jgi:UDP-N-acetylmuramoyl-L-alanyl-D-glutamate--2,6-diaminopimelate ligase
MDMEVQLVLLRELIHRYDASLDTSRIPDLEILGIQEDSRLVRKGDLFVARQGSKSDGATYIADAKSRGAVAVVTRQHLDGAALPQVVLPDQNAASILAHLYHGQPSKKLKVVGITGTNGKTTTTYLIRHILNRAGNRCGLIGTVEVDDGRRVTQSELTTPRAVDVASLMARMRDSSCTACAIEASSHALDQGRVAGVQFAGAGFTNLTGDHLDYHGTMEKYAAAKARLFEMLDKDVPACVNAQDEWTKRMIQSCRGRIVRFSQGDDGDYRARDAKVAASGTHFVLVTPDGNAEVSMRLIGRHNIENALCAAAMCCEVFGLSVHQVAQGLADAPGARGRLQSVRAGQKFAVLVDYAHTDDALENVLQALRPLTKGKLRVVFGCGGERDPTKRPRMAKVAERLADVIYVTSDNPRGENPQKIIDAIVAGFSATQSKPVLVEPDRRAAIVKAISDAADDDVVLIAGKGHENYQLIAGQKHHFDDVEEAEKALRLAASA